MVLTLSCTLVAEMIKAQYFAAVNELSSLKLWEPSTSTGPYTNGRIYNANGSELVVTGPKLKLVFGGCKYNKMVCSVPEGHTDVQVFRDWINGLVEYFGFVNGPFKLTDKYPLQLTMRLSTSGDSEGQTINADLFQEVEDGLNRIDVAPEDITAGSEIIPVVKIGYLRQMGVSSIVLTVLKAKVFLAERPAPVNNMEWEIDYPEMGMAPSS